MSSSPSSSVQAARQRLGDQLRKMRTAADLSGRDFARLAGWADATNVTKVEKGQRAITIDHVRLWCRLCGASQQRTDELLADQASVAQMWVSVRELGRKIGLNATQKMTVGQLYEQVRVVRTYQTKVIPGLLQTAGYMTGVLLGVRRERQVEPDDVSDAVAERLGRQRCLRMPGKHFNFLLEETVLRYRPYGRERHREQLLHLLEVMRLPSMSLWIVPMGTDRRGVRPRESFDVINGRPSDFRPGSSGLPTVINILNQISELPLPEIARDWPETRWDRFASSDTEAELFAGDSLLYTDINPDNFLIGDNKSWAIDWAWPTRGAAFIDPACLVMQLISAGHSAASAESVATECAAWTSADPTAIDAFASATRRIWEGRTEKQPDADWLKAMVTAAQAWADHRSAVRR